MPSNRCRIGAMITVILAVVPLAACDGSSGAGGGDTIKIGVSLSLSGPPAATSLSVRHGIEVGQQVAEEQILDGMKLSFDFRDDTYTSQGAVANYQRFVSDHVTAVIGPIGGVIAGGAVPIAQQAGIPALTLAVPDGGVTKAGDHVFATIPSAQGVGPVAQLATMDAQKLTYQRPALLHQRGYDTGTAMAGSVTQVLAQKGIKPVVDSTYAQDETDFSARIALLKSAGADALFIYGSSPTPGLIIKQMRAAGVNATVLGDVSLALPTLPAQVGADADGVIALSYWMPGSPGTEVGKQFVERFTKTYGTAPDGYAAFGFDTVLAIAHAVHQAGGKPTSASLTQALSNLTPFSGAQADGLTFNKDRVITTPPLVVVWRQGQLALLKERG